jgi:hypothetical protein
MASITRITIAALVFGVFLTASIATQAAPGEPAMPGKAPAWVAPAPDTQRLFPLRKLDPRCTGRPPLAVAYGSRCVDDRRVEPHVGGRHAFDTNA